MTTGLITNIQRYSVNDGYGIRTIVFLSGCTIRCFWCQNPETMGAGEPEVMFTADSCGGCGACLAVCPSGAVRMEGPRLVFDRERCSGCFRCVDECYFGARKRTAERMDVDAVFAEVMRDESFFRASGGGLTLSGGEPLMQVDFARELLARTRSAGVHNAVETAGNVPASAFDAAIPLTDLFLYDVKLFNDDAHRKATGVSNGTILANLARVAGSGVETIVRVPLIPGVNDGGEFDAIVDFVASFPALRELHILPYHTIGASKYEQLGLAYPAGDTREDNEAEVARCARRAETGGLRVSVGGAGFSRKSARGLALP